MVQILQVIWHCLMYCNSCVNPFIYNYASKDFRDGFRDVVSRWGLNSTTGGTALTSGQHAAATRQPMDVVGTGGQHLTAGEGDANDEGDNNEIADEQEFTVGGVYCGPRVEHVMEMQLNTHSMCSV